MLELMEVDVFVKYIEYQGQDIPEEATMRKIGGEVVYIDSGIDVHSSTLIGDNIEH
jgi:bifunctional ADP-heptose synthase (sugar kinase/adenylyltransferase)